MTVQQTIIKGVKELLFFHNYLVLPKFGGFVLKINSSHFSGSGTGLIPPSKTITFNAQLKQDDSVLVIWLQNSLNCSPAEALVHLHDFAEFCTAILATRRRLSLDGIGFFYLDFENNISFEPQSDANFLTDSFGLTALQLNKIETIEPVVKNNSVFIDRTTALPEKVTNTQTKRHYQHLVTPLVLVVVLFSLLIVFVSNNKISGPLRASVFGTNNKGVYEPIPYADLKLIDPEKGNTAYVADANGIATIQLNNKTIAVKAIEFPESNLNHGERSHFRHKKSMHSTSQFEIVLGCFTILENANKMADKVSAQNISAIVSEKNDKGMYVVSSGNYGDKESAIADLAIIKNKFPKAWIKQP